MGIILGFCFRVLKFIKRVSFAGGLADFKAA
jgi:hypothetical protein